MVEFLKKLPMSLPQEFAVRKFGSECLRLAWFGKRTWGIRLKLVLITLTLITLTTFGSSLVVISIMDDFLLQSLIERGSSISTSVATPAGFSILSNDLLALDNLVAKIKESQTDVTYVAIIGHNGTVLAHNQLTEYGKVFEPSEGQLIQKSRELKVQMVNRDGRASYEFVAPILFATSRVGDVVVGITADSLVSAKKSARSKILWIAVLALSFGAAGTMLLATFLTAPIKRLAAGVQQIQAGGGEVDIKVTSRDELGELTASFNEMSKVILSQKDSLESYARNLEESYTSMVRILAAALDARDKYTLGHSGRVAWLSLRLGQKLGLEPGELKDLEMACFLHDIGKIRVPDVILTKESQLDEKEFELIMQHPVHGAEILGLADSLRKYIPAVLHHHEWFNGEGYPHRLKGRNIHLHAQIVAIADSYDAMTSSRPYRRGRSKSAATREIKKFRGTQFSPLLVDIFIEVLSEFDEVQEISFSGGFA
jgi:HD-GYP domain-containing protein (c-di-GMP phosphodiesterase class II)